MTKVFIDGSAGTTGLRIADRLAQRQDIALVTLPDEIRKDINFVVADNMETVLSTAFRS